jgi:hypothetical protein
MVSCSYIRKPVPAFQGKGKEKGRHRLLYSYLT